MHSSLVWATLAASLCRANPIASAPLVQAVSDHGDLVVRQLADVPSTSVVKREDVSFDLTTSYNNTEIFDGSWVESIDGVTNTVSLALTCLECYLAGTVTASVVDSDDLALRLDFADVEGYFDLGLTVSDTATYTYTIYSTESPVGVSFTSGVVDVSIGLVLYVDLVFSLSAEVDLEGGFTVQIADGSYLETDILAGTISNSVFSGTSVQAIPVTLKSGEATFQADLRLRAECGADAEVLGLGVDAELGVYANLLEFIVEAETSDDCDLLLVETWDINAGAYIDVDVVIDYSTFGAVPTVSTTLYLGTTYSQCIGAAATATASVAELAELSVADSASITAIAAAVAVTASEDVSASVAASTASAAVVLPTGYASASGDVSYSHYFVNGSFASATGAVSGSGSGSVSGAVSGAVSGVASASGAASASASVSGAVYASLSGNSSVTTSAVSTVYSTSVYTITSCAATVINCPASLQTQIVVTKVVTDYTTVCPVTASASASASSASASASAATVKGAEAVATSASASVATAASKTSSAATQPTKVVITDVYVVVPCATPIVATYTPPTSVPSIVISVIGQSSVSGSSVSSAVSSVATSAKVSTVTKASTASTAATAATVSTAATASTAAKASTVSAETEASTAATEASTVSAEAVNAVAATSSASASVATFYGNGTSNGAAAKSGFVTGLATGLATGAATSKTAAASVSSPAILAVSATPVVGAASATASSKTSSTATAATAVVTAGAGHAMTGSFVAVVGAVAAALLLL